MPEMSRPIGQWYERAPLARAVRWSFAGDTSVVELVKGLPINKWALVLQPDLIDGMRVWKLQASPNGTETVMSVLNLNNNIRIFGV